MSDKEDALRYHAMPIPGKVATVSTKACDTARDLSLAYSPGVAYPCLEIAENEELAYNYTSKGNLVAVITNGTAVLGLGDIGPSAAKPVMEGKGVLFKVFAHVDVFDLELNCKSPDQFIQSVVALAPSFGGINLEDIKAPECFYIEEQLKKQLDIPVFHDDQHGTAIIATAALINALELTNREMKNTRLVVSGAGAAAIACVKLLYSIGMPKENILLVDSQGVVYKGRSHGMNEYKQEFAVDTNARTLEDAMAGCDVFYGLSKKDLLTPQMLLSMSDNPIVFAMANPDPEIDYQLAKNTRKDVIMATGRSDWPNQVNNVLGFPYIFRGALDVRAKGINEEMKLGAVYALAKLAKEPVPNSVRKAYGNTQFSFGPDYLIPKPFDPRVLYYVAPAVAEAAMKTGLARKKVDMEEYTLRLKAKQDVGRVMLRSYYSVARKSNKKRIVFSEGTNREVLRAAYMAVQEEIASPVLVGRKEVIVERAAELDIDLSAFEIVEPITDSRYHDFVARYCEIRKRRGITMTEARRALRNEHIFANMMLATGQVDGLISGINRYFADCVRPILQIVGLKPGVKTAACLYLLYIKDQLFFFADTAINTKMTSEKLADIAVMAAEFAESLNVTPRVAMLSYSNFGSVEDESAMMVRRAKDIAEKISPGIKIDGEMQADTALVKDILVNHYPFSTLDEPANVLIFPDMQSGNIGYKLLQRLAGAMVVGPIILGVKAPAYVMQKHVSVDEIFNMITVAVAQASLNAEVSS